MASKGKKKTAKWVGNPPEGYNKAIALIALVGVIAIVLSCLVQNSGALSPASASDSSGIRINELMSENGGTLITESAEAADWVELYNGGGKAVKLKNWSMILEQSPTKIYSFPDITLQPGEYFLLTCSGKKGSENSLPFKLAASGNETLVLMNEKGQQVDAVITPELSLDSAYARTDDGSWQVTSHGTPGEANVFESSDEIREAQIVTVPGALEITEVMTANTLYYPDENGNTGDYVEIHNISGNTVDLNGWAISDSSEKLRRWEFPSIKLPADGYIVVYCTGRDLKEDKNALHTNFKLSSDGESVYLTSPEGTTVSTVDVPALLRNQAYSYENGVWTKNLGPTPWMANGPETAGQIAAQMNARNNTGVVINEIMASPSSQSADWIELYNSTGLAVDISGWGISDDASKPRKYQFPSGTVIGAGQYMGLFMSNSSKEKINDFLNSGFTLSMDGGYTMCLSAADGTILETIFVPQQYSGISYGRAEGRSGYYFFESGTPGTPNSGTCYSGRAEQAVYSVQGGLFHSGDTFEVELSAPQGSRIFYTTDSTDPTESSNLYQGPITVSSTTILRTRVYRDGCMPSYMKTQSYLYDINNGGNTVYVVSLVSDPYNLTSDEAGIMVKGPNATESFPYGSMNHGANFWMDWEREAHVELYTPDGQQAISQECGIKLHGQYSRAASVKAIKVLARSEYGDNTFSYPIFSNRPYSEYQSFVLRASGQDYNLCFMRDTILTSLARNTSVMYMEHEIGVVFINGQYYSMMYLRERISKYSICQFEGWEGQEDDIDLIKANSGVKQGSNDTFAALLDWLKSHDTSTQEAYDKIDAAIDIQNYLEYMSMEIFVGNGDTLNVKRYRNKNADGKWRWVLFDLDWAFWVDTNSPARWMDPQGMGTGKYTDTTLWRACMNNPTIRDRFLTHFGERLATDFSTEAMTARIEKRLEELTPILPDYLARINQSSKSYKKQYNKFLTYAKTRPSKILEYMNGVFKFTDEQKQKYFGAAVEKINAYKAAGGE